MGKKLNGYYYCLSYSDEHHEVYSIANATREEAIRAAEEREQGFIWSDAETTSSRAKRNEYRLNKNSSCMNTTSHRSNMTGSGQTSKYIVARIRKKGQVF